MGGGALSSHVSKLGSKEVSKKLRNFSFAIKKACHCEDERSEDVAIAKSLNINEITPQSTIARNDINRHPELVSGSQLHDKCDVRSRNCVRDDRYSFNFFNTCHRALIARSISRLHKRVAFTLAEVLITLGIIGVVASLTLPSVIHKYKTEVLKTQFKKSYSSLSQAVLLAREDIGVTNFKSYCVTYDDRNYVNRSECSQAILKQLKTTGNTCQYDRNKIYTYSKTQQGAYVDVGGVAYPRHGLPDGTCADVMINARIIGVSIDINGYKKGPNALGHDIFSFWVNDSGALVPIKSTGYKNDDQIKELYEECGTDDYRHNSCASGVSQAGRPCTKYSNQKGNGLGCSWYAVNDISPDDPTKGYWESLPR